MISFKILLQFAVIAAASAVPGGWGWGSDYHSHDSGWGWGSTSRPAPTTASTPTIQADKRSLDELYVAALAEGGKLIVYGGGDSAGQLDGFRDAFLARFPNMSMEMIVDFSKNQDARIDLQLSNNTLIPDVTHLQTLQDFTRWKSQGALLQYKPVGWEAVYPEFKDADGFYTGILVVAFSNNINKKLLPNNATWPTEARDYLRPEFKGKIVSTYPNDDDAVLFWYKQVVDKYGWQWVTDFVNNNVTFVRGAQYPSDFVYGGKFAATFTTDGLLIPDPNADVVFVLPKQDPFVSWAQRAAIFKNAKNPAAAKLYLSWFLDKNTQSNIWYMWSVRKDVPVRPGWKSIFEYPGQTDPTAFPRFMEDRAAAERFRAQITQIVGEVKGDSPPGNLGTNPTTALPH